MIDFFTAQMDYVFFFYGLSFVIFAAVCYILTKDNTQPLPWLWLGLFGFAHAAHDLLDLLFIDFGSGPAWKVVDLVFTIISFLCLMEFGRAGVAQLRGRAAGRWIYALFLALTALGGFFGVSGLDAASRYALSLVGGLWASYALYLAAGRLDAPAGKWLMMVSAAIGLYALSTGIAPPPAPFFPASVLNSTLFLRTTGMPVQLIRAAFALTATICLWAYSQTQPSNAGPRTARSGYAFLPVAILLAIVSCGWVLTVSLGKTAKDEEIRESTLAATALSSHLNHILEDAGRVAVEHTASPFILEALLNGSRGNLDKAREVLDQCKYHRDGNAPSCYLFDARGRIIVSCSNRSSGNAGGGSPYGNGTAIREALAGKQVGFFASDNALRKWSYYVYAPVRNKLGRILGVTEVEESMGEIEASFRKLSHCFFVDRQGVIILSSGEDLSLKSLWPLTEEAKRDLAGRHRSADARFFSPLMHREAVNGAFAVINGIEFLVTRVPVGKAGHSIVFLNSTGHIRSYRLFAIFVTLVLCGTVIFFYTMLYFTKKTLNDEAVRESEARFRGAFESAAVGASMVDQRGRFLKVNRKLCEMLGFSEEELLSKTFSDVTHPEDIQIGTDALKKQMAGEADTLSIEKRYIRKDGQVIHVNISPSVIRDRDGKPAYCLGLFQDITERKQAEDIIARLHRKNELILNSAGEGIYGLDLDGNIAFVNPAAAQMVGWETNELIGRKQHDILHHSRPDGTPYPEGDCKIYAAFKDGKVHHVADEVFWRKDGTSFPIDYVSTPLREGGNIVGVVVVFDDISERKQVEESLKVATVRAKEERARTEAFIAAVGDAISIQNTDFRIIFQNQANVDLFGSHVGECCYKAYHGRESVCDNCHLVDMFRDGQVHKAERRSVRDNRVRYFEFTASPLKDAAGAIIGGVELIRDITARKESEEALKKTNAQLQTLIHTIPDMVVFKDVAGRHVIVNRAVEEVTGHSKDEITGKTIEDLLPPGPAAACRKSDEEAMQRSVPTHAQERIVREDGRETYFDMVKAPMVDPEGNVIGLVAIGRDITERQQMEEALRTSEANYRALLEQASDGIAVIDGQGRYLDVNSRMCDMMGYSREEFLKLTIKDVLAAESLSAIPLRLPDLLAGKTVLSERIMLRKDGSTFPMEISAKMIPDGRLCGIHRDITERKRAEALVRKSEEKYKNLVELSADIIYLTDKEGNQAFMNDQAFRVLEYSREEVIGKPWSFLIHPDDRGTSAAVFAAMIEQQVDIFNFENRYVTKGGNVINVLHNVRILRNEQGEIVGTQGIARDITQRKQVEDRLKLFSRAMEEATDGVQIVDLDGRIVYTNRAAEEMHGYAAGELTGKHVNDMGMEREFSSRVIIPEIMQTGSWSGELMNVRKNGSRFPIWLSTALVKNEKGEPIAMVGIIRDITERRRAETALRKSHVELEVLVHERTAELRMINEQLSMFSSYLQEAREKERTAIAREIHDELGQALTALKMDLSWLKKRLPKNQKLLLEKEASMSELVEATIQTVKKISTELRPGILDHLGLTAAIEWQAEEFQKRTGIPCGVSIVPEEIVPDKDRSTTIFRIFQETLTNITRHAKATKVSVRLEKENNSLILEVSDNGKGITEKQLSDSKSLGLMGIRERAAYWGGYVNMKGVRNGGTTVIVHIPLERTGGAA